MLTNNAVGASGGCSSTCSGHGQACSNSHDSPAVQRRTRVYGWLSVQFVKKTKNADSSSWNLSCSSSSCPRALSSTSNVCLKSNFMQHKTTFSSIFYLSFFLNVFLIYLFYLCFFDKTEKKKTSELAFFVDPPFSFNALWSVAVYISSLGRTWAIVASKHNWLFALEELKRNLKTMLWIVNSERPATLCPLRILLCSKQKN